jgi:glucose/arabinose dehydrogenase
MNKLTLLSFLLIFSLNCHAVPELSLPDGFSIEQLPFEVPNARQMALTDTGTLIVGTRRAGKVYAIRNALSAASPNVITLQTGLTMPSGVAVFKGDLFIGATDRILKIANIDRHVTPNPPVDVITDQLPDKRHHGWKYLKFGPDQQLYVPVGAPCNICLSEDPRFASLLAMDPATGATNIVAHGIRNTVGFAWHPQSKLLYFSDNGRDMLGDDVPPEEINVLKNAGAHFGYPFVHATAIEDPEFGDHPAARSLNFVPPVLEIQAHSAVLGMDFNRAEQFPAEFKHALFLAEHGSWNRTSKVGYQVSVVTEAENGTLTYAPFVTGWLDGEDASGRPNDVLFAPDGSLLISDDKQGVIYRVSYTGR